ncbi:hypothetical protein RchiOBHm_Chr1g0360361 [Rosa chinensis]|uniref:Uncharacterized protein n=1 Tax=Rosa chinensis TaxID=74649 RepID=A0A2P6SIN8_ROSCH|nr:hypothetical protein RchiOBHm_Chr1g0360361 [Rosa chinensis]
MLPILLLLSILCPTLIPLFLSTLFFGNRFGHLKLFQKLKLFFGELFLILLLLKLICLVENWLGIPYVLFVIFFQKQLSIYCWPALGL